MLRVALFAESSAYPQPSRGRPDPFRAFWAGLLGALGRVEPVRFIPINKKHLVAMSPNRPRTMSGADEGLDKLIARKHREEGFDAAVVLWDLVPFWNELGEFCRWRETLLFYERLGASEVLPEGWAERARQRHQELVARPVPSAAPKARPLQAGDLLAVCIDPMVEGLILQDEGAVRRALGLSAARGATWPTQGWGLSRRPDTELLKPVLQSMAALSPRPEVCKQIQPEYQTRKAEWGEYLLRQQLADSAAKAGIVQHPVSLRLAARLPSATGSQQTRRRR